jgi:hypothetical protein
VKHHPAQQEGAAQVKPAGGEKEALEQPGHATKVLRGILFRHRVMRPGTGST